MSQINETAIKTPGVYTTEIPVFPPSVAQVATAVPAFIGYTEKAIKNGKDVKGKAVRLSSLVQFVQYFGDSFDNLSATVSLNDDNTVGAVEISPKYQLFNAMQLFFNHGGTNCYVISVGPYKNDGSAAKTDFIPVPPGVSCFDVLAKEDEPTLIVIPDAVLLGEPDFNDLMIQALKQCGELQDRFTIMDIRDGFIDIAVDDVVSKFRNGVTSLFLNYGAAYYPWLRSNLPYKISYANTKARKGGADIAMNLLMSGNSFVTQLDNIVKDKTKVDTFIQPFPKTMDNITGKTDLEARVTTIKQMLTGLVGLTGFNDTVPAVTNGPTVQKRFDEYIKKGTGGSFTAVEAPMRELLLIDKSFPFGGGLNKVAEGEFTAGYQVTGVVGNAAIYGTPLPATEDEGAMRIASRVRALHSNTYQLLLGLAGEIQNLADAVELSLESSTAIYANMKAAIKREGIIVPPSGAIAGVYAAVDGTRGVWKAPANVPLNTVIEPMVAIDNNMQDNLNIDVNAGKSVNAIRTFSGKGTYVWGARTLAGNDNEWRYISVRRFFIMVEESAKKATEPFVFEPNDANTWAKVRGMLENYLLVLWRQGALAGAKPEHAFFVKCGIGQTMTPQDILEGKLIVEIGMAAVRPAEFIILRFSHKLQES